ncbi:Nuclear export factor GLE1 [Sphingomonas sp. EC-HK361]|uniref:YcnI family copper-binding membrane protein n=1 Tax=Sphingomonas sp. EC-HK361 TaxID=2038397 RepID=UPI0012549802|nr:YcnI family protein [Sphingomonas sp. EC-HK361]VVT14843.1 Nuclear export factor GLE1 [Sphingomonas sp. EC-HK361]
MTSTLRAALAAALAASPTIAAAHIVLAEPTAKSGSYYAGFFRVSDGCDGAATTSLRIEIPAGVTIAHPQPKPGWTLSVEKETLATPITSEGKAVRERVRAITWTGRLDPEQFDQFGVMMKLPQASGPLYFPTTQRCGTAENAWVMIPAAGQAWHALPRPAPVLDLSADAMPGMNH